MNSIGNCLRSWAFALGIWGCICIVTRADDHRINDVVNNLNRFGRPTFSDLLVLTGVKDVLNATSGVTVLAPSEDAFKQFFDALVQRGWNTTCCGGSVEELPVDVLTMITQYHVIGEGVDIDLYENMKRTFYPVGPQGSSLKYEKKEPTFSSLKRTFEPDSNWPDALVEENSPYGSFLSGDSQDVSKDAVWYGIETVLVPQAAATELERLLIQQFPLPPVS